jgi:hypothetical protein
VDDGVGHRIKTRNVWEAYGSVGSELGMGVAWLDLAWLAGRLVGDWDACFGDEQGVQNRVRGQDSMGWVEATFYGRPRTGSNGRKGQAGRHGSKAARKVLGIWFKV